MTEKTDEKLIEQYRAGNVLAFDEICRRYAPLIAALSNAFCFSGAETGDLRQEGLYGLFTAVKRYDKEKEGASSFATFAYRCVKTSMLNLVKKNSALKIKTEELAATENEDDASPSPEELAIKNENLSEKKRSLLEELSSYEKDVFVLYLRGYEYVEIAEILKKSSKSVDNALNRIKEKAKRIAQ